MILNSSIKLKLQIWNLVYMEFKLKTHKIIYK